MMALNRSNITGGQSQTFYFESIDFKIAKITFYAAIFILSCIGNSFVAIVIIGAKDMRTPSNFLILNLALCDFVTPALGIPLDLALEESNYIWPFERGFCKVLWPFETAVSISSSLSLAVISLERFRALSNPFAGRISSCHVLLFILTIHILSTALCIPYYLALNYNDFERSCKERWTSVGFRQAYTIVLCLFEYILPLITMSVAYMLIYRSLRSNLQRLISRESTHRRPRNASEMPESSILTKDSVECKRKEQNIHLARMFVIVVVVFAISMFPNQVLWMWLDFGNGKNHKRFLYISVACRLCTYANSVLNPFIYALKSKEFRSGFARIGRAGVRPLRKISSETRRFVRKVSRNLSENQRTGPPQNSTQLVPPAGNDQAEELHGKVIHKFEVCTYVKDQRTKPIIFNDGFNISISKTLLCSSLLNELRETDC